MKRHLLLAAVLAAPLYLRQREVERLLRVLAEHQRDWTRDTNRELKRFYERAGRP